MTVVVAYYIVHRVLSVPVIYIDNDASRSEHPHSAIRFSGGVKGKLTAQLECPATVFAHIQLIHVFVLVAQEVDLIVILEVKREYLSVVIPGIVEPSPVVAQFIRLTPCVSSIFTDDVGRDLKTPPNSVVRDVTHEEEDDDVTVVCQNCFLAEGRKFLGVGSSFLPLVEQVF